jgi:hypothetical protein
MSFTEVAKDVVRRFLKAPLEARTGTIVHHVARRRLARDLPAIDEALQGLHGRWGLPEAQTEESPVFVLAAGWRSGSTLLQRLVMSDDEVLIWGEAYDRCCYVQRLAETVRCFDADWPPEDFFLHILEKEGRTDSLTGWIANLYPDINYLRAAHGMFFNALLSDPAKERGYARWGLKEVRLSAEHASYLKWLYPNARLLFLVRDPYAAYRSYRAFGPPWFDRWPDTQIMTPRAFGDHWARLAGSFLRDHQALGARLIRFEDLVSRAVEIDGLSRHLGLTLKEEVLAHRVTGRSGEMPRVPNREVRLLANRVRRVADQLGYTRP